jgi:hypothetical protein
LDLALDRRLRHRNSIIRPAEADAARSADELVA